MTRDLFYIYDKITKKRELLGETQSGFNMSFVIDGTKDSTQIVIWSFSREEAVEPYTICKHAKTETWWCVKHDKVERYLNDNGTFLYIHTLQLNGAIELFGARDLTDCGFNQRTYTIEQFIRRLISLSGFEYEIDTIHASANFLAQNVDFVKTFENYTLASAIREFLDGYNMVAKLLFDEEHIGSSFYLTDCVLNIIPKTGDNTITALDISVFDDVRESKTIDSNSFGTSVVSNAENVISSIAKTFPATGSVKASGTDFKITPTNAVIRLPSKVYKANWLKIMPTKSVFVLNGNVNAQIIDEQTIGCNITSDSSIENMIENLYSYIANMLTPHADFYDPFVEAFESQKPQFIDTIKKAFTITLYNGNQITSDFSSTPAKSKIVKGENVPYIVIADFYSKNMVGGEVRELVFCSKEEKNILNKTWQGISWERGSNLITGFDCFDAITGSRQQIIIKNFKYTDLQQDSSRLTLFSFSNASGSITIKTEENGYPIHFGPSGNNRGDCQFIINYIPMSDIKLKVDNTRDKRDVQLYNQNGKLTDNIALSKLINSYAKEISSDTITRFKNYYNFDDVPKVGTIVKKGTTSYVINNVSLDFSQNEKSNTQFGYFIEAEITMSKYVSTKSLMVNPNTNIRDYGIPQNFNVKRKQLYRDYYELSYTKDTNADFDYLLPIDNVFVFGYTPNTQFNLIAVIQCDYAVELNGSYNWYFQLETTTYDMNKMFYIVCDFNDNNIIGYASQNVWCGFVINRVFSGMTDVLNTPVSYVDKNGQFKGIDMLLLDNEQITSVYEEYIEENDDDPDYQTWVDEGNSLYNYSCFIPQDIYLKARENNYKIRITESSFVAQGTKDYNKDALEVPVFEYCCQANDSEDVIIGDGIFHQHDNCIYFYKYIFGNNLTEDNVYDNTHVFTPTVEHPYRYRLNGSVEISYFQDVDNRQLIVKTYQYTNYESDTNEWTKGTLLSYTNQIGKDMAVFRHAINIETGEEIVELLFIAKSIPESNLTASGKQLVININHWKLN